MGALVQAFNNVKKEGLKVTSLPQHEIKKMFGGKVATRRAYKAMSFNKKSAVVFVGVSGIEKKAIKLFMDENPDFKRVSFSECFQEALSNLRKNDENILMRDMLERFERKLKRYRKSNIVIDGNFLHVVTRAALIKILNKYGYEIHLVWFPWINSSLSLFSSDMVEIVNDYLYMKYLQILTDEERKEISKKADVIHKRLAAMFAKEKNMDVFAYCESLWGIPEVYAELMKRMYKADDESFDCEVKFQEKNGLTSLGADYYYQI